MWKRGHREKAGRSPVVVSLLIMLLAAGAAIAEEPPLCFTILHTNDEHSALLPVPLVDYHPTADDPTVGGIARLSQLVRDMRAAKDNVDEPVVLVSAGDILGGAPHFWLIPGGEAPEISLMQHIGYDVITIGNHDFDYGPEILAQYYRAAGYPAAGAGTAVVSSNLLIPQGHPLAGCGILDTHMLVLENGLRLGFFGLLGENAAKLATKKAPIEISYLIPAAASAVKTLQAMDADVIIGVTHSGRYEDEAVASAVAGIDVMISGHFHSMALNAPIRVGETILVQSSAYLQHLGVLELAYTPADGTLQIRNEANGQPFLVPINDSITEDPVISKDLAGYTEKLNLLVKRLTDHRVTDIHDTVLHSEFVLEGESPSRESILGDFVTDAMRLIAEERTGERVDFAIQANGVIRGDVRPGSAPYSLNKISFYDLATSIGLGMGHDGNPGYPLVSIYLTGNEIYRVLELTLLLARYSDVFFLQISGGRFVYDPAWVALFRIPFTKVSLPTFRAVREVERFTGRGPQTESGALYQSISRGDDTLYHVVCDYYILSFFPKIAEKIPFYKVVPKDRDGREIGKRDAIIQSGDRELKFWQAVVEYALAQPRGSDGIPRLPEYYARPGTRMVQEHGLPLVWLIPALALGFLLACILFRKWRRRRMELGHNVLTVPRKSRGTTNGETTDAK